MSFPPIYAVLTRAFAPACCAAAVLAGHGAFAQEDVQSAPGAPAENANASQDEGPAGAEPQQSFEVQAYDVEGNTILPQIEIEKAVYPQLGPGRTNDDVEKARAALERAYHSRGYQSVVVEVPPQTVEEGVIRLRVVEAPVGRLRVVGSRFHAPSVVKRLAPSLAEGQTPNFTQAQKELAELNRLPDRQVTPVVRPGKVPGTVDIDLKVEDTLPLHASLELNNEHAPDTEPLRLNANIRYANLWQQGNTLSLTYLVAPQNTDDAQVFAASYIAPVWKTPWTVLVYGYTSDSNISSLGGTSVLGKGYAIGVRGIYQLPAFRALTQSVNFGFDFKHFDEAIRFGEIGVEAPIEYVPFNAVYSLTRTGERATSTVSAGVTAGIRGFGSGVDEFQNKRAFATPNFVKLNLDLSHVQRLRWGFEVEGKFSGQAADQPLVSSEQFAIGGRASVRGYLQAEAVGDHGILGSAELRFPSLAPLLSKGVGGEWLDELRFYTFADAGKVWILDPLPDQDERITLYSVGLGLRLQLLRYLYGDVAVGVPLRDSVASDSGDPFVTFSAKAEF
jgi:hemolysin activation/secretion protein